MPSFSRRGWRTRPRVLLAGVAVAALLLPSLPGPLAGIGREAWEDPSAGPFRDDPAGLWALFVLNLNDRRCSDVPLGLGDLTIAEALRDELVAQGVPASRVTILLDAGGGGRGAASETNVRAWIDSVAPLANARSDSRVLFFMAGHGFPYTVLTGGLFSRPLGSYVCLNGGQEMLDYEFGGYLAKFNSGVQVGTVMSCSFCGGFTDRIVGPVETVGASGLGGVNRVATTGCGIATECLSDGQEANSVYLEQWALGVLSGQADGWTGLVRQDVGVPHDTRREDGRVTLEEAYWFALSRVPLDYSRPAESVPDALAPGQRFQIRDALAGGFVVTGGGHASVPAAGTGDCGVDLRDYDQDGVPNAVDVLNSPSESRAAVPPGGTVTTASPTNAAFRLVVTSPSGNSVTFQGGQRNMSLDAFVGEPMDGTWVFDHRSAGPIEQVLEVRLGDKMMSNSHARTSTDLGVILWNWHADSRTDDSLILDFDPCGWTGARLYAPDAPGVP